jgi:hypothetical protein
MKNIVDEKMKRFHHKFTLISNSPLYCFALLSREVADQNVGRRLALVHHVIPIGAKAGSENAHKCLFRQRRVRKADFPLFFSLNIFMQFEH